MLHQPALCDWFLMFYKITAGIKSEKKMHRFLPNGDGAVPGLGLFFAQFLTLIYLDFSNNLSSRLQEQWCGSCAATSVLTRGSLSFSCCQLDSPIKYWLGTFTVLGWGKPHHKTSTQVFYLSIYLEKKAKRGQCKCFYCYYNGVFFIHNKMKQNRLPSLCKSYSIQIMNRSWVRCGARKSFLKNTTTNTYATVFSTPGRSPLASKIIHLKAKSDKSIRVRKPISW